MIVVAGGSGLLGQRVVANLVDRGERVRVLARDAVRARAVVGNTVEVAACDVRHPETVSEMVAGASVVICAVHGFLGGRGAGPTKVDDLGNAHLIDSAAAIGADVVLVSVLGASPTSPLELFRAKAHAEQHLRASTAPWTILRPAAYLETWLGILTKTAGQSGRPLVFGRGLEPIDFVSVVDVAALVSRAATDSTLRGQVLDITGERLTLTALAVALQGAQGWRGSPRHLPRPVLRSLSVLARPFNPAFARQNATALAMDTGLIAVPSANNVQAPSRHTLPEVLAAFIPG